LVTGTRTIPGDWHPGFIPDNVVIDPSALIETSYAFLPYRSEAPVGLDLARGAGIYTGTMLDLGPRGRVTIGECGIVTAVRIVCDSEVEIGPCCFISWNVILMDSYRTPVDPEGRRRLLQKKGGHLPPAFEAEARPIRIGKAAWIGFDSCVLPGVTIGEASIVGARSVVVDDVPPYTIAVGNPARVVRQLERSDLPA
jgi:acetyltransferase-like isoleucine patch superfamily enzyme